jgi:hypothetical protein
MNQKRTQNPGHPALRQRRLPANPRRHATVLSRMLAGWRPRLGAARPRRDSPRTRHGAKPKDTSLSREGLYRSLSADGNPEFATILKVVKALGLSLHVGTSSRSGMSTCSCAIVKKIFACLSNFPAPKTCSSKTLPA